MDIKIPEKLFKQLRSSISLFVLLMAVGIRTFANLIEDQYNQGAMVGFLMGITLGYIIPVLIILRFINGQKRAEANEERSRRQAEIEAIANSTRQN